MPENTDKKNAENEGILYSVNEQKIQKALTIFCSTLCEKNPTK